MSDENKILERVRKMMALANNEAATEGERDNALRMAYNLLAKHALSMEDVEERVREATDPRGEYTLEGWGIPWCRSIRNTIARMFMCKYIYTKINATRCKHSFIGRESNATTAMLMGDWIVKALLKEADKRYGHRLTPEGRSFGEGAAAMLQHRVYLMQREAQAEQENAVPGSAVALVNVRTAEDSANDEWIEIHIGKLRSAPSRSAGVVSSAFGAGKEHAKNISLNTQVTAKKGTLRLK